MAMTPNAMANFIIGNIAQSSDPVDANTKFYQALCNYVETNALVLYSWTATSPPPASLPDPMVVIPATIKTFGTLTPSGATDCSTALSIFSQTLNTNAATWTIIWPPGFLLSPAFVIPTISITPSMATDQSSAMISVCSQIIAGLKLATPIASGTHGNFVGTATFTSIS